MSSISMLEATRLSLQYDLTRAETEVARAKAAHGKAKKHRKKIRERLVVIEDRISLAKTEKDTQT